MRKFYFLLSFFIFIEATTLFAQTPALTSFFPANGSIGTPVAINGTNFSITPANNIVFFGASRANVVTASATQLLVQVPAGATYASITVTNTETHLTCSSSTYFVPVFKPSLPTSTAIPFDPELFPDNVQNSQDQANGLSSISDFDGDGKPDILVAYTGNSSIYLYHNINNGALGKSSFAAHIVIPIDTYITSIKVADINNDGKPDIIITGRPNVITVLVNNAVSGTLNASSFTKNEITTGFVPSKVLTADLDNDGKIDLAVLHGDTLAFFKNTLSNGSATISFLQQGYLITDTQPSYSADLIDIADMNNDGKPDLIITNATSKTMNFYENLYSGGILTSSSFAPPLSVALGHTPIAMCIADFTSDGKLDIAFSHGPDTFPYSQINFITNATSTGGNINMSLAANAATDFTLSSLYAADFDGDGKPDIVGGSSETSINDYTQSYTTIYRNVTTSSYITVLWEQIITTNSVGQGMSIGDLDGDNEPDFVIAGNQLGIMHHNVNAPPHIIAINRSADTVGAVSTITGFNFSNYNTHNIVYFGATKATSTEGTSNYIKVTIPAGASLQPVSLLNTDNHLTGYAKYSFPIQFQSDRAINANELSPKFDMPAGTQPYATAVGDLDGDGKPDLVVTNSVSGTISVYHNYAAKGGLSAASFFPAVTFATGYGPTALQIMDVDNDGKPDIVVTNYASNSVSVFRNTTVYGSITSSSFAPKVAFTVGSGPIALAISDIDGDGKADIIVANNGSNSISILRNTSTSGIINTYSFAPKVDFATGTKPDAIAIGDLNFDGAPDIIVANSGDNTASIFQNTAVAGSMSGSSLGPQKIITTGSNPSSIILGNFYNGAGLDIAITNKGSNTISFFHNNTDYVNILLDPKQDMVTGTAPSAGCLTDMDGDGKEDFAVTNSGSNTVSFFHNESTSNSVLAFSNKIDFATGNNPTGITIADMDNDSRPDVIVANNTDNTISILHNVKNTSITVPAPVVTSFSPLNGTIGSTITVTGTGFNSSAANNIVSFGSIAATVLSATTSQLTIKIPAGAISGPISVLNTDNHLTAYSMQSFNGTTFPSNGDAAQTAASFSSINIPTVTGSLAAVGDLDGDGKADAITVLNNKLTVFKNNSSAGNINSASFSPEVTMATDIPGGTISTNVLVRDIDGDGKPDLIFCNWENFINPTVEIFRNIATPGAVNSSYFASPIILTLPIQAPPIPITIRISDLDGDGKPEIIVGMQDIGGCNVFQNLSTVGSIAFGQPIVLQSGAEKVEIADMDSDGKPDIITSNAEFGGNGAYNQTVVYRNVAAPGILSVASFQKHVIDSLSHTGGIITVNDFDNDGKPDIAETDNINDKVISIYKNTSTPGNIVINKIANSSINAAFDDYNIGSGDINGDGTPDLFVDNEIFLNNTVPGSNPVITFAAIPNVAIGANEIIQDMDNDGKPDFVTSGSNGLTILRNTISLHPAIISSFSPLTGPVGTSVTITGKNFNRNASDNTVYFGAVHAIIDSASTTRLVVKVPAGATYEPISILDNTSNLTGYSIIPFITTFNLSQPGADSRKDFATDANPTAIAIADIDGDGKADMVVANSGSGTISVYHNASSSGVLTTSAFDTKTDFATGSNPVAVTLRDLDGDGKPEIIVANSSSGSVSILRNNTTQGSINSNSFSSKSDIITGTNPTGVAVGDIDGDGRPDLFIANAGSNTTSILLNTSKSPGIITFAAKQDINTGLNKPVATNLTDIDGDGKVDMLIAYNGSNKILVLHNSSTPGKLNGSLGIILNTGNSPQSLITGDIDKDGKPDICVINTTDNTFSVFKNQSASNNNYSFQPRLDFSTGLNPQNISAGDVDGDGKPDLVVSNSGNGSITVFRNTTANQNISLSSFTQKASLPVSNSPYFTTVADIDGDGKSDLLAANYGSNSVSIYRLKSNQSLNLASFLQVTDDKTISNDNMIIYPNPTSAFASVKYNLPVHSEVTISIYNKSGRLINSFKTAEQTIGTHENILQTSNLETGVYLVIVKANNYNKTGTLIIQ